MNMSIALQDDIPNFTDASYDPERSRKIHISAYTTMLVGRAIRSLIENGADTQETGELRYQDLHRFFAILTLPYYITINDATKILNEEDIRTTEQLDGAGILMREIE